MTLTKALRLGLGLPCLMLLLPGCGTLRGLLTPPPAPPADASCPRPPPAELFAPVPVPRVCLVVETGEDLVDCAETCPAALAEANTKLAEAEKATAAKE